MSNDQHMLMCLAEYLRSVDKDASKAFDYASKIDALRTRLAANGADSAMVDELRECMDLMTAYEGISRNNFESLMLERIQAIKALLAASGNGGQCDRR